MPKKPARLGYVVRDNEGRYADSRAQSADTCIALRVKGICRAAELC